LAISEKEYAAANVLAVDWFLLRTAPVGEGSDKNDLVCWHLRKPQIGAARLENRLSQENNCRPKGATGTETSHVHFSYRSKLQKWSFRGIRGRGIC
jgi:hypothetical protein